MPALDFPSSPTNGQTFGNWVYNSTKGAWQSKPLTPAKTITSPTPPTSPTVGDQWFDTDTGQLFIYYNDGNTSQWVESRAPITADGYISPNYIINGGMDIWQRGTSHSSLGAAPYTADRWQFTYASGSTGTISRSTDIPANVGVQYSLSMAMTTSQDPRMIQKIESVNAAPLAGKTVTLSYWAKSTVGAFNLSIFGQIASAPDNWSSVTNAIYQDITPTSTWQRYSVTTTLPASVANGIQIVFLRGAGVGAASTTLITGVQLEEGSVATPFRRNANSIQGELAACQRYYEKSYDQGTAPGSGVSKGCVYAGCASDQFGNATYTIKYAVEKRTTPDITFYTTGGLINNWQYSRSGVSTTNTSMVADKNSWIGTNQSMVYGGVGAANVACTLIGHWVASAEL